MLRDHFPVCPIGLYNVGMLWPTGWMNQYTTWYGCRPRRTNIALDGDPASRRKGHSSTPLFCPCLFWPTGWMDQDTTWYGGIGLGSGDIVLDGDPASTWKGARQPPFFGPSIVAKLSHISATAELLYLPRDAMLARYVL